MATIGSYASRAAGWTGYAGKAFAGGIRDAASWTWNRPGKTGQGIRKGVTDSFGFQPGGGFLGTGILKPGRMAGIYRDVRGRGAGKLRSFGIAARQELMYESPRSFAGMFFRQKLPSVGPGSGWGAMNLSGVNKMRAGKKLLGRALGPGLGLYFTASAISEGYEENGIIGAVTGGATQVGINTAVTIGMKLMGGAARALLLGGGSALVGTAGYLALDAGAARTRRRRELEFGRGLDDPFGNIATARQRSLQAMQNTHLNTRSLLGQEAQWMHMI